MRLLSYSERGDTLVEVLMAIAVVSSVLTAGFLSSNKSLQSTRASQQRAEALKLAEAQAEVLASLANDPTAADDVFSLAGGPLFCLDNNRNIVDFGSNTLPLLASDTDSGYPTACKDRSVHYRLSVLFEPARDDLFTVRARWVNSEGTPDEVALFYRIHKRVVVASPSPSTPPATPPSTPPPSTPPPSTPPPPVSGCNFTPNPVLIPGGGFGPSHLFYNAGGQRLEYTHDISAITGSIPAGCRYRIIITTRDPDHPDSPQPNERLYARFILANGGVIETGMTNDLATQLNTTTTDVGTFTFPSPPVRINFRHYYLRTGDTSNPNSIDPQSVEFIYQP